MSLTRHLHFAADHQPRLPIETLLQEPRSVALLKQLGTSSHTLNDLSLDEAGLVLLRRLRQVNLVLAYEIGGVVKYRAHRLPPVVRAALAA